MRKKFIPLIFVLLFAFFAAWPLLTPGFIPTHDGEYHIIRFFEFDKNIKAGIFFPRWAEGLNSGLGVPLFNFFYPLPNYVAEFFHLLGITFVNSFKLTLATGVILGTLFFYFWLKEIFGAWPAVVGAIFYTLAPYHLVDVYVRGSVGEVLALALFPAVLWSLTKKSLWAALFLALLILSHNILALIFTPFLISYMIFSISTLPKARKLSTLSHQLSAIFFGLGFSCYFWLPALAEAKYVTGLKLINFTDHFPALFQLILPSWGSGFSVPGINDKMSFQIGVPHLIVVLASLVLIKKKNFEFKFLLAWFLIIFLLLLDISLPFWKMIPGMSFFQYPWRLLSLMILVISFLAAHLIFLKKSKLLVVTLILLALIFYIGYSRPVKYSDRSDNFYLFNPSWIDGTATLNDSFNTKWIVEQPEVRPEKKIIIEKDEGLVEELLISPVKYRFKVNLTTPAVARINTAYFPGWQVLIDGQRTKIDYQKNGLINFQLSPGEHEIKVKFSKTPIRDLASKISLLSLFFWGSAIIVKRVHFKNESCN